MIYEEGIPPKVLWPNVFAGEIHMGWPNLRMQFNTPIGRDVHDQIIQANMETEFWKQAAESDGVIYYLITSFDSAGISTVMEGQINILAQMLGRPIRAIHIHIEPVDFDYMVLDVCPDVVITADRTEGKFEGFYFRPNAELNKLCWCNKRENKTFFSAENVLNVKINDTTRLTWRKRSESTPDLDRMFELQKNDFNAYLNATINDGIQIDSIPEGERKLTIRHLRAK